MADKLESIRSRVRQVFDQLTASQKEVAKFVLKDTDRIATMSAKEIGAMTDTSETTVIRFCVMIGYSGYAELQKEVQNALVQARKIGNPIRKLGDTAAGEPTDAAEYIRQRLNFNAAHMERTLAQLSPPALEEAVERIRTAPHIIVIGLRASFAPAHWLAYALNILRGNTELYRGGMDDGNYLLSRIQPGWLVVAISFPRYMRETIEFAAEAKRRSAQILVITDDELAPLAFLADQVLKVETDQPTTLQGMPAVFSLLSTLTGYLAVRDREKVRQRLDKEQEIGEHSFYFINHSADEDQTSAGEPATWEAKRNTR